MTPEIDQAVFNRNLLLTQAYCDLQLQKPFESNAKVLRTINPEIDGEKIYSFDRVFSDDTSPSFDVTWNIDPFANMELLVDRILEKQSAYKDQVIKKVDNEIVYKGKILVTEVEYVLPDGASAGETSDFIDEIDWPPADTWFYKGFSKDKMLVFAWIPDQFVQLVDQGIAVNILEVFYWYNNGSVFAERQPPPANPLLQPNEPFCQNIFKSFFNFFKI